MTSTDRFLAALPAYYGPAGWPHAQAELAQAWYDITADKRWDGSVRPPAPVAEGDLTWLREAKSLQSARSYQGMQAGGGLDYRLTGYRVTPSGWAWTVAEARPEAPAGLLLEVNPETGEVLWCDARRRGRITDGHRVPGRINAFPVDLPAGPDLPDNLSGSPIISPDEGHLLGRLVGHWLESSTANGVGLDFRYTPPAKMAAADHLVAEGLAVPVWGADAVLLFITARGQLALHRYQFRGRWESWPLGAAVAAWEDDDYRAAKRAQVLATIARLHRYPEPSSGYTMAQLDLIWEAASKQGQRWIDRVSLPVALGLDMLAQLGPMLASTLCQAMARDMADANPDRDPDDLEPAWLAIKRAETTGLVVITPYGKRTGTLLERTLITPAGGPHLGQARRAG